MDPPQPSSLYLRSTSEVSLHDRFSQVLMMKPLTRSFPVTSDPSSQQSRHVLKPAQSTRRVVRTLPQNRVISQRRWRKRRRSVWTRLGWHRVSTLKPPGFWSFRNKYKWGAPTWRRRKNFLRRLGQSWTPGRRQPGQMLQWGGASGFKGRYFHWKNVPTKKQLDVQLDRYMSLSRSRLDQDLDDYMSMSRRNLDAQLDDYMLMAGVSNQD